ncbi:MAG: hypothetical protein KatS3mg131_0024 [Candidatus Tectimicrobiota bacterium]|nr:MAG: hypothetical protein KatS3mg131_0024 [Candidatus Tectomicrobia bacterium]
MDDERLRPSERLRRTRDFQRVLQQGVKLVTPLFVLYVLPSAEPRSRLGIAVSRRVGKAVVRNRAKRLVREVFRRHKSLLPWPCDVVVIVRQAAVQASYRDYVRQYQTALARYRRGQDKQREERKSEASLSCRPLPPGSTGRGDRL